MTDAVQFEEETHTYTVGDVPVISVTQALVEAGLVDTKWFTDFGRRRGSAVHKAIEFMLDGSLDLNSIDPKISGYLDAYRAFAEDTGFEVLEVERKVWSPTRRYAGTLDQVGDLNHRRAIVDVKTGKLEPATGIQLTGYADAYQEETGLVVSKLIGLQLNVDGTYKMKQYIVDFSTWRAVLQVAWWKREN
jgi:hypothetical protein